MTAVFFDAVFDGTEYGLKMRYVNAGLVDYIKTSPVVRGFFIGDKTHPYYSYWRFNKLLFDTNDILIPWIGGLAEASGYDFDVLQTELNNILCSAKDMPNAFAHGLTQTICPLAKSGDPLKASEFLVFGSQYHGSTLTLFRSMHGQWARQARGWYVSDTSLAMLTNNLMMQSGYTESQIFVKEGNFSLYDGVLSVDHDVPTLGLPDILLREQTEFNDKNKDFEIEDSINAQVQATVSAIKRTGIEFADIKSLLPTKKGMLLKHQREGVLFLTQRTGALLADEMGTGKTRTAIVASYIIKGFVNIQDSNRYTVIVAAPKAVIFKWRREILAVYPNESVHVLQAGQSLEAVAPNTNWIITNYEQLERMGDLANSAAVLLIDEAHKLKESMTLRTRIAFEIASRVPNRYLLTATPILNRESEMHSLLRLTGHSLGDLTLSDFETQFSGSPDFRKNLNKSIKEDWMLRRLQSKVLRGKIPGKRHDYQLVKMVKGQHKEYLLQLNEGTHSLTRLHHARRFLEEGKVSLAVKYLKSIPTDEKLIVFCEYVESVNMYSVALTSDSVKSVVVTGQCSDQARDKAIESFQTDDSVRSIVLTYATGAEGIDLWRGNHVFLALQPYVPATQSQAEDRANRLGQTRQVKIVVPIFQNTLDEQLRELLNFKSSIAREVIDPDEVERFNKSALIKAIARQ
ncbi:DEAD/DEAH box helicase [Rhodoferax antarcticus]|uniref:DNA helicase conserved C-terminal domain protein n=1 Tax=Rhodoferax antarcticus ANT.BR TaxID=1111071 RepID=A0A1Q8Y9F2_9BURK|nr:DEAD/DEAH box helicase [Rhodoferax antarcticus]OLP04661.1 DNA helicase conserved C-terminal domain protein [Rhodoferax antarcticus ANT.BR]